LSRRDALAPNVGRLAHRQPRDVVEDDLDPPAAQGLLQQRGQTKGFRGDFRDQPDAGETACRLHL